ncbi:MAG: hypothetical protein M3222_00390 [Thermoproteota archaeon]|nr:hypothetical protein [Thermoproteota archaeon]
MSKAAQFRLLLMEVLQVHISTIVNISPPLQCSLIYGGCICSKVEILHTALKNTSTDFIPFEHEKGFGEGSADSGGIFSFLIQGQLVLEVKWIYFSV